MDTIDRAVLFNPAILSLDEVRSSVDSFLERLNEEGMDKVREGDLLRNALPLIEYL
ncbi:hypothetical protein ACQV2T_06905 [Facklamia sp. P13069]|uniref:hypothetical protein n=1 Tax=Facklamia sp. P13069 TaxID=3421954 RepID=UPI003D17ED9A